MGMSSEEKEAKKLEVPIFRLLQYNLTAREYQHATYGIVCAYAGEANAQDHAALFISSNDYGCFLSGHQHTTSFALTCENDLTTGLAALVDAASAPSDPYYDVVWPVIVSIDAIGPVELSEHCKYYIEGSRAAYDALTDEQKTQVTNYSTLTDAETQWTALAAAAQPYADAVIALINAIPTTDPDGQKELHILEGDIPSPVNPPSGCKFHTRCQYCTEICKQVVPEWREIGKDHFVACHHPLTENKEQ